MMSTLRCKESFAADVKGVPRVVAAGDLLDSSDPIVKGRQHLFEPVDAFMGRRATRVEQATAAPGEKRSIMKSVAKAAAKSSAPEAD